MGRFVFQDIRLIRPIRCLRYKVTTFFRNMQALNPLFFQHFATFFPPQIQLIKRIILPPDQAPETLCRSHNYPTSTPVITSVPLPQLREWRRALIPHS